MNNGAESQNSKGVNQPPGTGSTGCGNGNHAAAGSEPNQKKWTTDSTDFTDMGGEAPGGTRAAAGDETGRASETKPASDSGRAQAKGYCQEDLIETVRRYMPKAEARALIEELKPAGQEGPEAEAAKY